MLVLSHPRAKSLGNGSQYCDEIQFNIQHLRICGRRVTKVTYDGTWMPETVISRHRVRKVFEVGSNGGPTLLESEKKIEVAGNLPKF